MVFRQRETLENCKHSKTNSFFRNDSITNINSNNKINFTTNFKGEIILINKLNTKLRNMDTLNIHQNIPKKAQIISGNLSPETLYISKDSSTKIYNVTYGKQSKEDYGMCNSELVPTFGVTLNNFKNRKSPKKKLFIENPQFKGKILTFKELYPNENFSEDNKPYNKIQALNGKAALKGRQFEQDSSIKLRYKKFQEIQTKAKNKLENSNYYLNTRYSEEYMGTAKSPKPQLIRSGTSYEKRTKKVNYIISGEKSPLSNTKTIPNNINETIQSKLNSKYFSFRKVKYNARNKNNYLGKYYIDSKTLRPISANRTKRAFFIELDLSNQTGVISNITSTNFNNI